MENQWSRKIYICRGNNPEKWREQRHEQNQR